MVSSSCFTGATRRVTLLKKSHSWLIIGFVTILTRRVSLVEQELLILPEHLSSPLVFSGVCVTRSLVLCVCFIDCCLSFWPFSFGHCTVCSSVFWPLYCLFFCLLAIVLSVLLSFGHCTVCFSIYGFWLPLWYLQALLINHHFRSNLTLTVM
jgi:hypothetical protein